jgi:hypothetical protein
MKRYIAIVLTILTITLTAAAQSVTQYKVVRVVGVVENAESRKALKTGDVISSTSKLTFGTKADYIIISSPETGRKKISGVPDAKSRELLDLFRYFVEPETRSTASRGVSREYLEVLQASFQYDTLLILPPAYISINTKKLSLEKPAVIRAWYSKNKKIQYTRISDQSGFRLDRASLFGDAVLPNYPRVMVEYFEDEKDDPVFSSGSGLVIGAFVPLYPTDEPSLAAEIRALVGSRPANTTYSENLKEVGEYLAAEYANAQEDNLKQWLREKGILSE